MSPEVWLSFFAACAALCLAPGPTVLMVAGHALESGKKSVLPLMAGVLAGDVVAISCSLAGVGALLATSAMLFNLFKWVGAAWLIWLGIRNWRRPVEPDRDGAIPRQSAFGTAFIVTALNPKGIMFFVAFFPMFIDTSRPVLVQMILLGATFLVASAISVGVYGLSSSALRLRLNSVRARRRANRVSGGMLIGAGVVTAAMQGKA